MTYDIPFERKFIQDFKCDNNFFIFMGVVNIEMGGVVHAHSEGFFFPFLVENLNLKKKLNLKKRKNCHAHLGVVLEVDTLPIVSDYSQYYKLMSFQGHK